MCALFAPDSRLILGTFGSFAGCCLWRVMSIYQSIKREWNWLVIVSIASAVSAGIITYSEETYETE